MKLSPLLLLLTTSLLLLLVGGTAGWFAYVEDAKTSAVSETKGTLVSVQQSESKPLPFLEAYTQFIPTYEYTVDEVKYTGSGAPVRADKNPFPKKVVEKNIYYSSDNPAVLVDTESQTDEILYLVAGGIGVLVALMSVLGLVKGNRKILRWRV